MLKYFFILINTIAVLLFGWFNSEGGITVTSTIPATMKPGGEVNIELKVNKGNMAGFAKLQLDLPLGFTVKEIDNAGSDFVFKEGLAKWVWSALPTDNEIIVKCVLVASNDLSGTKTIGAKYSYVENTAKMVVEMTPVDVLITNDALVTEKKDTLTNSPAISQSNTTAAVPEPTVAPAQPSGNSEPPGAIQIERKIAKGPREGEFTVQLRINKGLTKGFARYSDDMQDGVTAKVLKSDGASFSVSDGKLKFVWVSVPEKEVLEISYLLSGVNKPIQLKGEYSYLEQNQSKKFLPEPEDLDPVRFSESKPAEQPTVVATNTPEPIKTPTEAAVSNATTAPTEASVTANATETQTLAGNNKEPIDPVVDAVSPKKDVAIDYMVQIGAFTNGNVNAGKLSKKFSINEKIQSEMSGGFSKFMVGKHAEYKTARDHREKMRNDHKVRTAFVVAYNTGKRITVQEALMVSNQKWYK